MGSSISSSLAPKLSICITTFNRGALIQATLESILTQMTDDCEMLVLDAASSDNTQQVVRELACRFDRLHYIRQEENNVFDQDCDRVVEFARGEYCWLMTDDDLMRPGAVAAVLGAASRNFSLIIVNWEAKDFAMSKVLQRRYIDLESDRAYGPEETDKLFLEVGKILGYIGCLVVKRSIWISRERRCYCGSLFMYLNVIFQDRLPGGVLVIAQPYITYRSGNTHAWSSRAFEIFMINWPLLVWSLPLSDTAKRQVCSAEPWRDFRELMLWRAYGSYSLWEYRQWIRPRLHSIHEAWIPTIVALLPGVLVNALFVVYYSVTNRRYREVFQADLLLHLLRESRFHPQNWLTFGRRHSAPSVNRAAGQTAK